MAFPAGVVVCLLVQK
jgi:hypothetical protein